MLSSLYVLHVATLALWLSQLAVAVGPVVQCEPCDTKTLEQCKPLSPDCAEFVQESLCGCCWTCALTEGSQCGVYSQKCGSGLQCRPGPEEPKPLHALLMGRGVCVNVTREQSHSLGGKSQLWVIGASQGKWHHSRDPAPYSILHMALKGVLLFCIYLCIMCLRFPLICINAATKLP